MDDGFPRLSPEHLAKSGSERPHEAGHEQLHHLARAIPQAPRVEDLRSRFKNHISNTLWLLTGILVLLSASSRVRAEGSSSSVGLLVMVHGGDSAWNAAVEEAVAPLRSSMPTTIAFGMADRASLQEGVRALESAGVKRIAVVRMFISGESFLHQTEYLLGLRSDPPASFVEHHQAHDSSDGTESAAMHSHAAHAEQPPAPGVTDSNKTHQPIEASVPITLSRKGLIDDDRIARVFVGRARELSRGPERESVLLLAHGMGEEAANQRLLSRLEAISKAIRSDAPYAAVGAETLREDWAEPRAAAERRIHAWIAREAEAGRRVLVLPVRLFGFGPYREVLRGADYEASEHGILPHPVVTEWIRDRARELSAEGEGSAREALR